MEPENEINKDDIIEDLHRTIGGYEFNLRGISTKIRVSLTKKKGGVIFNQSHLIHTPEQCDPYDTSHPWRRDESDALDAVLQGYRRHYREAVQAGHKPDDSWLKRNLRFHELL